MATSGSSAASGAGGAVSSLDSGASSVTTAGASGGGAVGLPAPELSTRSGLRVRRAGRRLAAGGGRALPPGEAGVSAGTSAGGGGGGAAAAAGSLPESLLPASACSLCVFFHAPCAEQRPRSRPAPHRWARGRRGSPPPQAGPQDSIRTRALVKSRRALLGLRV
jgi:hypothetical protein